MTAADKDSQTLKLKHEEPDRVDPGFNQMDLLATRDQIITGMTVRTVWT